MFVFAKCDKIYFFWIRLPCFAHPRVCSPPANIYTTSDYLISPILPGCTPKSHDEINSSFCFTHKSARHMWRFYSPSWSSNQSSARQSTTQSFIVLWRVVSDGWLALQVRGEIRGEVVRRGALLELCGLQPPSLDFQLHPPHRLRGKGKITSEPFCSLPLLRLGEQKHVLWSLLLDMSVNHSA